MNKIENDITPEELAKSAVNRDLFIDWSSLKPFKYTTCDQPTALDGWSTMKKSRVRIAINTEPGRPQRPLAVFYKQLSRGRKRVEEAYYLTDEEFTQFSTKLYNLN